MSSIYGRLGYNPEYGNSGVSDFTPEVQKKIDSMPPLLSDWQMNDLAANTTTGYFQNPCAPIANNLMTTANSIIAASNNVSNLSSLITASKLLSGYPAVYAFDEIQGNVLVSPAVTGEGPQFRDHTDRISGVVQPNANTINMPHYSSAMSIGKILIYLVAQSDGIQNNSPIMGNFTSLFIANTLQSYSNTINSYPSIISSNMSSTTIVDPETGGSTVIYTTSLTPAQVATMANTVNTVVTLMSTRRISDNTFYTNSQRVMNDYASVDTFSNLGASEEDLLSMIGTSKLQERLNANT